MTFRSFVLTSKVPAFSRLTWSFLGRSRKPGILLAKSTTSCTAGVKLMENSSQISWLDLLGLAYGDAFMGQIWARQERIKKKKPLVNFLKGFKKTIFSILTNGKITHQVCSAVQTAASFFMPPGDCVPFEFVP